MKKRITALLLGTALCFMNTLPVLAVPAEERITLDSSRVRIVDGTDEDEEAGEAEPVKVEVYQDIEISSVEDLIQLSQNCRLDSWSVDKRVILTKDISVYGQDFSSIRIFGGYFEGRGHTISGFSGGSKESFVGLFNTTAQTAVISNLNVEGDINPGGSPMVVGGIVGDNYGLIENCSFAGTIKGKDYIGGIAGFNETYGSIVGCSFYGRATGVHYTGGICGENAGAVAFCVNAGNVNVNVDDTEPSLTEINLDTYKESLLSILTGNEAEKKSNSTFIRGSIDTGGIAGLSLGAISGCKNTGTVGYEHVGYNTGGIAGRSSGYIEDCVNEGRVYGRKDVGGIVGQAEPYVQLDLTQDIISQITTNVNSLHDLIDTTLSDAGASSDTITMRLNVVKSFADKALDDTNYLANSAESFVDGAMSSANEAISRIDFVLKELNKDGGVFDKISDSAEKAKGSVGEIVKAVNDIDIEKYMSDGDRSDYQYAKKQLEEAKNDHDKAREIAERPYNYMFLNKELKTEDSDFRKKLEKAVPPIDYPSEAVSDLYPYDSEHNRLDWPGTDAEVSEYANIAGIGHFNEGGLVAEFPTDEDKKGTWYPILEETISTDKTKYDLSTATLEERQGEITRKVNEEYMNNHGGKERRDHGDGADYEAQMEHYAEVISDLLLKYGDNLAEQERADIKSAAGYIKESFSGLGDAGKGIKDIVSELNGKPGISLPYLGDEFRYRTNSLHSSMQGISDNLGFLNQEMAGTADTLIADLSGVNDQFNKLMLLFTDAIDGALEMDYTATVEDNSEDVAETCIDGTVADCVNNARIEGDLDVGGIAGTMAIEYEFDLESDITGVKDSKLNSTYLTKCVARNNCNNGYLRSEKSYCGGITGLQEMGTILLCENYGKAMSNTGDYVGGIAGQSLSTIKISAASSIDSGRQYVGGIAGKCNNIYNCFAIPNILEAEDYFGGIAGNKEDAGDLSANYFYGDAYGGIDGASYQGKAEPVSYGELLSMEGVPERFNSFTVSFLVNDEEVGKVTVDHERSIKEADFPVPEAPADCYVEWEVKELNNITSNMEVEAEEHRYLTTIAGDRERENGQSVLLVDGKFREEDKLSIENVVSIGLPIKDADEHFVIEIPKDGELNHQIRYQPLPEENTTIYLKVGNDWRKVETEEFGGYELFDSSGNTVELVVSAQKDYSEYIKIAYIAGGALGALILLLIVAKISKRRKKKIAIQT